MLDLGVPANDERSVDELAIDPSGERRAAQTGANARRDFSDRDRAVELLLAAIGQSDNGHR